MASLIAGEKAGVAPQADLVSVSVFRNRQAQPEAVVAALAWVKEQHVHVINLSAGFRPNTEVFASVVNQILQAGILVVCASGNSANICTSPGDYDAVLTVGASTPSGTAWRGAAGEGSGSGKARTAPFSVVPDLLAPGVEVWGAWPGDRYRALTGTSMAAPIVSGLAALEYQKRNALVAVDQVIFNLMGSADPAPDSLRSRNGLVRA